MVSQSGLSDLCSAGSAGSIPESVTLSNGKIVAVMALVGHIDAFVNMSATGTAQWGSIDHLTS
eukprot:m.381886 g.381886  ORF g.381886 m.381886 type:complete len:63 (+) comp28252_c0_seq9:10483-10671(+)